MKVEVVEHEVTGITSPELRDLIERFVKVKYWIPFLALLSLVIPEVVRGSSETWPIVMALALGGLGFCAVWGYQRRPRSVKTLFFMMDGAMASIGLLLTFGIWNMARTLSTNYWLYRDYLYLYLVVFLGFFFYLMFRNAGAAELKQQTATLRAFSVRGTISAAELYEVLTRHKGAKQTLQRWNAQRLTRIIGPIAVAFVGIGAWGGRDYILYLCFLLTLFATPVMLAFPIRRRIRLWRDVGRRDITITD